MYPGIVDYLLINIIHQTTFASPNSVTNDPNIRNKKKQVSVIESDRVWKSNEKGWKKRAQTFRAPTKSLF